MLLRKPSITCILTLACGLLAPLALAQKTTEGPTGVTGTWAGTLQATPTVALRLIVKVSGAPGAFTGSMDSIDQGVQGIPLSDISLSGDLVSFDAPSVNGKYTGTLSADRKQITGKWSQGAGELPLTLTRTESVPPPVRPQEPKPPYPYWVKDVSFRNHAAGILLAGTLTVPKGAGPFPAVVLIAGSGPQNRDEDVMGHRVFLVLADYLTRHGIAVLRYDKRGVGKSTGDYANATTRDFTSDALAAAGYLKTVKSIDSKRIGLIGHSEGGIIAPLAATESRDVKFIVLMAGPGLTGEQILLRQSALIASGMGASKESVAAQRSLSEQIYAAVKSEPDDSKARAKILAIVDHATANLAPDAKRSSRAAAEKQAAEVTSPWFRFFLTYDPVPTLKKVKCPVLALNGSHDLQVPAKPDLAAIRAALKAGGNKDYTIKELPGLNHLFQESKSGLPAEYGQIEQTISPKALQVILRWIEKHTDIG